MLATTALRELVEFVTDTRLEDIPSDVVANAQLSFIDTVGCVLGGMWAPEVLGVLRDLSCADGTTPVVGTTEKTSSIYAAAVEAMAGSWFDLDSGHRHPSSDPPIPAIQPPLHIVPALLASGRLGAITGADLLRMYILSYEATARLGVASRLREGLHGHGAQPTVGVAMASALAASGDKVSVTTAMGIALSLCVMADMVPALDGSTIRNIFPSVGVINGVLASELATSGFTHLEDPLDAVLAGPLSDSLDCGLLVSELGATWECTLGYFKKHACCRWNHPALDALEDLIAREGPIDPESVERIDVDTFVFASRLTNAAPASELGAKFSMPYAIGGLLATGTAGFDTFREPNLSGPDLLRLAQRVFVSENPAYTAAMPARRPTTVTLRFKTGRVAAATVQGSRGDPGTAFAPGVLEEKFLSLASLGLGATGAQDALCRLTDMVNLSTAERVVDALIPHPAPAL